VTGRHEGVRPNAGICPPHWRQAGARADPKRERPGRPRVSEDAVRDRGYLAVDWTSHAPVEPAKDAGRVYCIGEFVEVHVRERQVVLDAPHLRRNDAERPAGLIC